MLIQRQLTTYECTSSQHRKWVKEVKEGTNFHSTQNPSWSMHKHAHSKATYCLRMHQFPTQEIGKGKEGTNFHSTQKPILGMHIFIQR